ncbi:MAG TPA: hypothetical protein ENL17_01090 [Candidatus Methanoperedenaceae archaeon]|nr:hypothetical protein [Candidatus Methanoperedenaceae archaeon]
MLLDSISSARFSFPKKTMIIIKTIEDYVNITLIQHRRIFMDLEESKRRVTVTPRLGLHGMHGQPIIAYDKALTTVFFGDIHYYIVCWAKIGKLMKDLDELIFLNHDRMKIYDALFENCRKIRNSFEHIDERIGKEIFEIGESDGNIFTSYDGYQVDLKNGENYLREFYGNLLEDLQNQISP